MDAGDPRLRQKESDVDFFMGTGRISSIDFLAAALCTCTLPASPGEADG